MTADRTIWQVSAGPAARSYADVFLKYGVALIGPGDPGPWTSDRDSNEFGDTDGSYVQTFAVGIKIGDVFLLRTGKAKIRAIGLVASDYLYLSQFDDVNGWDLQHARRVRWCSLPEEYDFGTDVFGVTDRLSRVFNPPVVDYVVRFLNSPPKTWQEAPLPPLPEEEAPLQEVPSALRPLVAEAADLTALYIDRRSFGPLPTEDELVAHFLVPFLRSLGWPPERIAVKWRRVDVALFDGLPRLPETCRVVIEAKRFGEGIEVALAQARGYLGSMGIQRDVVVSDGIRYRLFDCDRGYEPVSYANLARLKRSANELFTRLRRP